MCGVLSSVQTQKVNYMNLPSPVRYEDSQREAISKSSSSYENFTLVCIEYEAAPMLPRAASTAGSRTAMPSKQAVRAFSQHSAAAAAAAAAVRSGVEA
jgi:hypothetical protein